MIEATTVTVAGENADRVSREIVAALYKLGFPVQHVGYHDAPLADPTSFSAQNMATVRVKAI